MRILFALLMFLEFFIWGSWYVSITGWLNANHLSELTAFVYSVCPIAAILAPLFIGVLADRLFPAQFVLAALHLLGAVFLVAVPYVAVGAPGLPPLLHPVVLLLLGHALCFMPTLGLANAVVFRHIANPESTFPLIRVCGTLGWIAGSIAVAFLPDGDRSPNQFYLAAGAASFLALLALALPSTPPLRTGQKIAFRKVFGLDALQLLKDRRFSIFILCSLLICIPLAGYYQQARNFIDFAQVSRPTFVLSFGQMSEVLFMIVMPLCFARLGVKKMLLIGMLAWTLRYGLFAVAGGGNDSLGALTIMGILLHGLCYDFFFVTGQVHVERSSPPAMRAQAQGLFVLVTQGVGMLIGSLVFGALVTRYTNSAGPDWPMIWIWPAAMAALVALFFAFSFRPPPTLAPSLRGPSAKK